MTYKKLPPVVLEKTLTLSHFPNSYYAAIFRLWETCSAESIARALNVPMEEIYSAADEMGLPKQKHTEMWEKRGYITTIRNAWHVLPYECLLRLLDMNEDGLAALLKDEDFFGIKLGNFKPYCEYPSKQELDREQKEKLARIKRVMERDFSDMLDGEPFGFFAKGTDDKIVLPPDQGLRMIYSYCGLYASALDNDISVSYPEDLLRMYAEMGVNAIWIPAVLHRLVPFYFDESYSEGYEKRIERLSELVEASQRYGIKVYLYLNEPRCMPNDFFDAHKELCGRRGDSYSALCTSRPEVMDYLRYAVRTLCESVSGLGGFFTITCSENLTHCKSSMEGEECPVCRDVPIYKLVSDVINAIYEESVAVDPEMQTIAWTWAWDDYMTDEEIERCIDLIAKDVVIQCNSEAKQEFTRGGIKGNVRDYSISVPGPAPYAKRLWQYAADKGHKACAKVQVNCSWECSTLPYLPVFDLIREHMTGLKAASVEHLMLSWTLGGYPSVNLKIASDALADGSVESYCALLKEEYGEYADLVKDSAREFSNAFREFPFELLCLYMGPQNGGPSNLLYEKKSGFGATMTCFAYDDLDYWRSNYPRETYRDQFKLVCEKWKRGLDIINGMPDSHEYKIISRAAYDIFRSSYLQIAFIMARDEDDREAMLNIAVEEAERALSLSRAMNKLPQIGYEAANHYYYNKGMLAEKVISCEYITSKLK